jgi:hypothetical protein
MYTHYWTREAGSEIDPETWGRITKDVSALLANLPAKTDTAGGYHAKDPLKVVLDQGKRAPAKVNDEEIYFNGAGKLGYETFVFERITPEPERWERDGRQDFCKTDRRPYDLAVCATLLVIHRHAPGFAKIESDGTPAEWEPARRLVREVLGYDPALPPDIKD